jgi:hypothetical protein
MMMVWVTFCRCVVRREKFLLQGQLGLLRDIGMGTDGRLYLLTKTTPKALSCDWSL